MNASDTLIIDKSPYRLLKCEEENIIHPDIFGISPTWDNDKEFEYINNFEIIGYQLYLKDFTVTSDRDFPLINGISPEPVYTEKGIETVQYQNIMVPLKFTGAALIGNDLVKSYNAEDEIPCFSYKEVYELLFQDGKLVTTIDHSKAMLRIRKNLDLGLRTLLKERDKKCINRFIKTSLIGNYSHYKKKKKQNNIKSYVKKIKSL